MRRVDLLVAIALAALSIFSAAITVKAQRSDRIIVNRPEDTHDRDATRPDRSEYELRTTITGTPSQVEATLKYAKEAFEAKPPRYADAEKYYLEAAKLNPKEERPYLGLGMVYAAQDKVKEAIDAFQKAAELKPKSTTSHFNLGVIFVAVGNQEEAMKQYTALTVLDKNLAKKLKEMISAKFKVSKTSLSNHLDV
jgi:tetratricopeptide (TPR) repeat protein